MAGGRPSGSRSTAPKSRTPSRPSGAARKLPGCGSACSSPARPGPENRKRSEQRAGVVALLLRAVADDRRTAGVPSIHSVTSDLVGAAASTCGHDEVRVARRRPRRTALGLRPRAR